MHKSMQQVQDRVKWHLHTYQLSGVMGSSHQYGLLLLVLWCCIDLHHPYVSVLMCFPNAFHLNNISKVTEDGHDQDTHFVVEQMVHVGLRLGYQKLVEEVVIELRVREKLRVKTRGCLGDLLARSRQEKSTEL